MLSSLAAMLLAMVLLLDAQGGREASAPDMPVSARIYTDDSGTARMDLYYLTDGMPDRNSVPARSMYGNGLRWRFDAVTGPVKTDLGECWVAGYTRLEYE